MKRAALYVRVSTQEQKKHGLSVDSQIVALQEYAKSNNIRIANIYNDAGISARKRYTKRPALLQLLDDCKSGKIDIILFTKLDRWFRSVGDYYEVQRTLDDCRVPWRAIWEDYETETSSGIFKVNIMLSVAQSEADRTSERIKSAMAYKKERGDYIGSAPIGYIVKGRYLLKDPQTSEGMTAFFEKYLSTFSVIRAVEEASQHNLNLNRNHMLKLMRNPVYYGEAKQGYKCEPYITKEEHELIVQNIAKNARQSKYPKRTFLFSGMCVCGYCGHRMSAKGTMRTHADGAQVTHKKYLCQYTYDMKNKCPSLQISEKPLEKYLFSSLDSILQEYRVKINNINSKVDSNGLKRKKDLESKLKRLATLYTDGDITIEDYRLKRDSIKDEINSIVIEPIPVPPELPTEWKEIYEQLDDEHKRSFWLKIIKSITVTNETKDHPKIEFL